MQHLQYVLCSVETYKQLDMLSWWVAKSNTDIVTALIQKC